MDSNHRPRAYQARALATWATDRFFTHWLYDSSLLDDRRDSEPLTRLRRVVGLLATFVYAIFQAWTACGSALKNGGDEGIRTLDPLLAGQVLSQLSYTPIKSEEWKVKSDLFASLFFFTLGLYLRTLNWILTIEQQNLSVPMLIHISSSFLS